ncbi:molecular chaperone [Mycobacterium sp. 852002-51613_SCH5001154]|uniref:Hsp70 family protein n=1 Tax=Mycobacterium sp. 852002-51613_SCH5001154 TaxID=1834104 RepID=UPI0007FCBBA4|nr:Hsp70 family protein [Mycobacterium sp. 852002-51613_SCH5001154]OBF71360.1 molecular chaperone [Mycobacterium sp. 852002-51613_SCH5001154]
MANGAGTALGLSIGTTNLAAVAAEKAITRKPVLTLYPERAPEVGIPAENPRLNQPGLVITGFVNRISDPRGVVAADGSVHRSEELIADAMRALAYSVTGGRTLPESVAVTYPAHWPSPAVDAVGTALSSVAEWSNRARPLMLIPDAAATLLAVRTAPGLPAHGTVAVCDFGGSGTSVTFMRADGDYQALAPTVRLHDFSGDLIDQALLSAVISNMPSTAAFDPAGTVAIGSLSRLRTACRSAKEELSATTAATLSDGLTGEVRVTRDELDEAIRTPLDRFVAVLENALARNGIQDLVAVVSAGGGANIPAITTTLSQYFRVPVITTPRPQLTAATGAALRAAHGPGESAATASAPAAPATATARAVPSTRSPEATATAQAAPAWPTAGAASVQAWSQTGNQSQAATASQAAPAAEEPVAAEDSTADAGGEKRKRRLFRLPVMAAIVGAAAGVALVGTAVTIGLTSANKTATTPAPGVTSGPVPAPPANTATAQAPPPSEEAPAPSTTTPTDTNPPAQTETPSTSVPSAKPQHAPPLAAAPVRPAIPQVPPIPPVPGLNEAIPGLDRINQIIQGIGGDLGISGIPQLGSQLGTTR